MCWRQLLGICVALISFSVWGCASSPEGLRIIDQKTGEKISSMLRPDLFDYSYAIMPAINSANNKKLLLSISSQRVGEPVRVSGFRKRSQRALSDNISIELFSHRRAKSQNVDKALLEEITTRLAAEFADYSYLNTGSRKLHFKFFLVPNTMELNHFYWDPVNPNHLTLGFAIHQARWESLIQRSRFLGTVAHEAHHALNLLRNANERFNFAEIDESYKGDLLYIETSALLFGYCVELGAMGRADIRSIRNHFVNGRAGGVFTDAELIGLNRLRFNDQIELWGFQSVLLKTIWASLVGPVEQLNKDTLEGQSMLAFCKNNDLSVEGIQQLITRLAKDGVDAPLFADEEVSD